jgi:hypothetical protein
MMPDDLAVSDKGNLQARHSGLSHQLWNQALKVGDGGLRISIAHERERLVCRSLTKDRNCRDQGREAQGQELDSWHGRFPSFAQKHTIIKTCVPIKRLPCWCLGLILIFQYAKLAEVCRKIICLGELKSRF